MRKQQSNLTNAVQTEEMKAAVKAGRKNLTGMMLLAINLFKNIPKKA